MRTASFPLTSIGHELDTTPEAFGQVRSSMDAVDQPEVLRQRMAEDGYLYMPGLLNRDDVLEARSYCCGKMADLGWLDPTCSVEEGIAGPEQKIGFTVTLTEGNQALMRVLYAGPMIEFYERLLGGPVRHYDYTWFRNVARGHGTNPHCDVVYMGRGTHNLYTSWTPVGDVSLEMGGLMVMEKSHLVQKLRDNYGQRDVDLYCDNRLDAQGNSTRVDPNFGRLTSNPARLRRNLGLRWLTGEYRAGDLLAFHTYMIHCSLDNHTDVIRLSSDSRYQLASEPIDDRWISIDGKPPTAHGPGSKRGMIC